MLLFCIYSLMLQEIVASGGGSWLLLIPQGQFAELGSTGMKTGPFFSKQWFGDHRVAK